MWSSVLDMFSVGSRWYIQAEIPVGDGIYGSGSQDEGFEWNFI